MNELSINSPFIEFSFNSKLQGHSDSAYPEIIFSCTLKCMQCGDEITIQKSFSQIQKLSVNKDLTQPNTFLDNILEIFINILQIDYEWALTHFQISKLIYMPAFICPSCIETNLDKNYQV